ncbi:inner centromere protein isoform X2 [Tiliqua scincoides]|uniref:inner centromere protein isoform X2 n=1 Tax=Tiliqua scincoides TaxID=71010 RepID=UPI003463693A
MRKMLDIVGLEERCKRRLSEVLHNVDNRDLLWLQEICEDAINICNSSGEPELMPKTPSQKNCRKKKCLSSLKNNQFATKRLSKRDTSQLRSSKRISQELQQKKDLQGASPCRRVTRSQVAKSAILSSASPCRRVTRSQVTVSARLSNASLKNAGIDLANGRIPLVEIGVNERRSAELHMGKETLQTKQVDLTLVLSSDDESPIKRSKPLSKASLLIVPDTPEAKITKQGREACKLKIANITIAKTTESKESGIQEEKLCAQQESTSSKTEPPPNSNESPQTPTGPKANRRSVRRSLMGRTSENSRASLMERYSLSSKRERMIQKSIKQSLSKRKTVRQSSSICRRVSGPTDNGNEETEEITETQSKLDPVSHSQEADKNHRMSLQSQRNSVTAGIQSAEQQQGGETEEGSFEKGEVQKQPQSVRRKASYKRAVNELDDGPHTEDELSPPRKKTLSPQCPASKVVRPFKTFLHTVQKNQRLMMTPGSGSRNSTIKSFLKQNTPLQTNLKEKERQRLENLRKKEEAEEYRKQKMEEEKRRRREEMKQKREERLRKVLQARERFEQMEEEKKRRLELKLAQHEEKNEKVRDEKMAEEKVKKKVAAKKREELEARRKQEVETCRQKALQLEEEDRRRKELLQKKREEEELEKARKLAEQRQAELEKEKKLSAEREQEKKREQEKLQAQREHEQQEKEKAVRLQKELMAAKEQLRKEVEEKEKKLEQQKQEEQQKATSEAAAKAANKQLNRTVEIENSPACNSYQMTPQAPKQPKIDTNNYGMDLNSDDSTDDESQPRKPIPTWATGNLLSQAIIQQYYKPPNTYALFGVVKSPKLEEIFYKNKPRYFKRTSSAVWNSPPFPGGKSATYSFKRC